MLCRLSQYDIHWHMYTLGLHMCDLRCFTSCGTNLWTYASFYQAATQDYCFPLPNKGTVIKWNPAQKWYFFPGMTREECLVFKTYDSIGVLPVNVPTASHDIHTKILYYPVGIHCCHIEIHFVLRKQIKHTFFYYAIRHPSSSYRSHHVPLSIHLSP